MLILPTENGFSTALSRRFFRNWQNFTGSRTAVWILGWLMNMLMVSVLNVNIFLSTLLVGIVGMVVNYSLSKQLVFHTNGRKTQDYEPFKPDAVTAMHACKDVDIASAA